MILKGRIALLSGASKGLGRALALALDSKGCQLRLVARDSARLDTLQQHLQTSGSRQYPCDLSDVAARDLLISQLLDQETRLDLIIHCAGIGSHSTLDQLSAEEVRQLLQLNTLAPLELTAELLPLLPTGEAAGIVHIGSVAGELTTPGMSLYSASKHALHAFSRATQVELSEQGHFSLLLILGPIRDTDFGQSIRNPIAGQPGWYRRLDVDPAQAAERIVRAIEQQRSQLLIPRWYRPLIALSRLLAPLTRAAAQRAYRKTRPVSDDTHQSNQGYE